MTKQEKYKVWWDEKNGAVRYDQLVDMQMDQEWFQEMSSVADRILKDHSAAYLMVDLVGLKSIPDFKARKVLSGLSQKYSSHKAAVIHKSLALRTAINFTIVASGNRNTKAFAAEALKWLKEDN